MDYFLPGCFGKLPIFSDFIRFNANGAEIQELDQWLQKGIQLAKTRLGQAWRKDFEQSHPWNFLYLTENTKGFLLGVYVPGRDQSGRQYPFLVFLRIERSAFQLPVSFAPLLFSGFLTGALELAGNGWKGEDIKTFVAKISSLKAVPAFEFGEVEKHYLRFLESHRMGPFWAALFGDFQNLKKYLLDRNLDEILQPFGELPLNKLGLGLKFPLCPSGEEIDSDIPFWIDLACRRVKGAKTDPVIFWRRTPERGESCQMVFFNPPLPKHFLFMVRPDLEGDSWFDLTADHSSAKDLVVQKIQKGRKELLDREDISLLAFLEAAGGSRES